MPLWAVKLAIYALGASAVCAGAWATYSYVKHLGYVECSGECRADALAAENAVLTDKLEKATAAANIGRLSREKIVIAAAAIELRTEHTVEIVKAAWDRPACPWPDSVQTELQNSIDEANRAAAGEL